MVSRGYQHPRWVTGVAVVHVKGGGGCEELPWIQSLGTASCTETRWWAGGLLGRC